MGERGTNIVLIGFMGTGKSSVGRRVAARRGHRFVDVDRMVVDKEGAQITEIFEARGEGYFREVESAMLRSLAGAEGLVIATGGGIVTRPENVEVARGLGFIVWLTASEAVIAERVARTDKRPLLRTENPRETISRMLAERRPLYEAAADFTIDTSEMPHSEVCARIVEAAES